MAKFNFLIRFLKIVERVAILIASGLIRFYQIFISPSLPASKCRFSPSCSQYMLEAIAKKGFFKGCYLGIRRLLRCQPFSKKSGFDPVK